MSSRLSAWRRQSAEGEAREGYKKRRKGVASACFSAVVALPHRVFFEAVLQVEVPATVDDLRLLRAFAASGAGQ